jgi:predicted PurR-regulated permease PerM
MQRYGAAQTAEIPIVTRSDEDDGSLKPAVPTIIAGASVSSRSRFRIAVLAVFLLASAATLLMPGIVLMLTLALLFAAALSGPVERLRRLNIRRGYAAAIAVGTTTLIVLGIGFLVAPWLGSQIKTLLDAAPSLLDSFGAKLNGWADAIGIDGIDGSIPSLGALLERGASPAAAVVRQSMNVALLIMLTPFVAYFMLARAPQTLHFLRHLPPPEQRRGWIVLAAKLRQRLGGYLRGLALIASIQAALLATALTAIGLNFGLVIGIAAGLSSFIPVIGNLVAFFVVLAIALVQFDSLWPILAVCAAFGLTQLLETAVLEPYLMGSAIAVPPLPMILALLVGGSLFGIIGAIVAVPAIAAASVIAEIIQSPPLDRPNRS